MTEVETQRRNFLFITGLSGSGKSYMEKELNGKEEVVADGRKFKYRKLMQVTTRPRRVDEYDYSPYLFTNKAFYNRMKENNMLIATSHVGSALYGTINDTNNAEGTINTVIVNRVGYESAMKDLDYLYGLDNCKVVLAEIKSNHTDNRGSRNLLDEEYDMNVMKNDIRSKYLCIDNNWDEATDDSKAMSKLHQQALPIFANTWE